jgi:oligoribonuclease (3'-5' exoribonuclease)
MTKVDAIQSLRPGAQWVLRGDDLEWMDTEQTQPTDGEIEAEVARLTALEPRKARIAELKALLTDSDYKVLPDYDKNTDAIKAQRQAWREEIRTLEAQA